MSPRPAALPGRAAGGRSPARRTPRRGESFNKLPVPFIGSAVYFKQSVQIRRDNAGAQGAVN